MQISPTGSNPHRINPTQGPAQQSPTVTTQPAPPTAQPVQPTTNPTDNNSIRDLPQASFDPSSSGVDFGEETQQTQGPKETYVSLSSRLNANPNINYIELDRSDLNKGLSDHLNQFNQLLTDHPELRAKLEQSEVGQKLLAALDNAAKGFVNTEDILNIQTFIVASGIDIHHQNSATGIDGDYGPKTHAGLSQAFDQLLNQPEAAFTQLEAGTPQATEYADTRRRAYQDSGDAYVHGQSRATTVPANYDMPANTGDLGAAIASAARRNASNMGTVGYCMKGVRTSLDSISEQTGIRLRMPDGSNIQSAYMAADVIRNNFSDRFDEMSFNANDPQSMAQLRNLPPGAIVVWGNNPDPSTHARGGGWKHGHISIALGGGMEASDHVQQQITNRNGKYGSCTVFIPKG